MIIELLVLGVLPALIVIVLVAMVFSVGVAFGLPPEFALLVSIFVLGPTPTAVKDLWVAISGRGGEEMSDRVAVGIRGLALLIGSATFFFHVAPHNQWSGFPVYLVATCAVLFIGTDWRALRRSGRLQEIKMLFRSGQ